ncbi:cyclic nucleotide-binding domain-containing protein [Lebetimonas sp. JS138]|uniref:cyclic nucleotide-binding domain-containing protein n=1 Tax=Lebetimonas sp. JS138 TaxID=990072 RepID=UPI000464AE64|nr:cyclic nucleotide-binding domain-containing protein [Lebetimonas sp. JS138]
MKNHPIFKTLNNEEYEKIKDFFKEKKYKKDEILVKEGEYSGKAFILKEGEVSVIKETIYKNDYIITDIKAGGEEFFGEVNLIDRGLVTSTIKAKTDILVFEIDHNDFIEIIDTYPTIGVKMLWIISYNLTKHLRKADRDIITLYNAFVEVVEND